MDYTVSSYIIKKIVRVHERAIQKSDRERGGKTI